MVFPAELPLMRKQTHFFQKLIDVRGYESEENMYERKGIRNYLSVSNFHAV